MTQPNPFLKRLEGLRASRLAATPGEWSKRESSDFKRASYVDIRPGYFAWFQFVDNEVTKMLRVKPNDHANAEFIAIAASNSRLVRPLSLE